MSSETKTNPEGHYQPQPIDTSQVSLDDDILELTEVLARSTHDTWALRRLSEGWRYGPERNDARKEHPGLVPYEELSDGEKDYDRGTALETLKAVLALGYRIEKPARRRRRLRENTDDVTPTRRS